MQSWPFVYCTLLLDWMKHSFFLDAHQPSPDWGDTMQAGKNEITSIQFRPDPADSPLGDRSHRINAVENGVHSLGLLELPADPITE